METWNKIANPWKLEWNHLDIWEVKQRTNFTRRLKPLILDLGCGSGRDVEFFTELGIDCVGIDFSKKMLENSSNTVCSDVTKIPFMDNVFDAVWSCSALKYLNRSQIQTTLDEVRRVLKPQGLFWLGLEEGKEKNIEDRFGVPVIITLYTIDTISSLLKRAGFKIIKTERVKVWRNFLNLIVV